MAKVSAAEMEVRMASIVKLLLKGVSTGHIMNQICKSWGIKQRTAEEYIAACRVKISETSEKDREYRIARAMMRFDDLYMKNYDAHDYRECRAIQESIAKMFGDNEPDKQDITSKGEKIGQAPLMFISASQLTEEQIQALVNRELNPE